jgi:hypothetical protein
LGAQGTTTVNFGAFPGKTEATTTVSGQTGFISSSLAEAWIYPVATADHSVDEHLTENLVVKAYYISDGNIGIVARPTDIWPTRDSSTGFNQADFNPGNELQTTNLLYGLWTIAWVWN